MTPPIDHRRDPTDPPPGPLPGIPTKHSPGLVRPAKTHWWHSADDVIKVGKALIPLLLAAAAGAGGNALATKDQAKQEDVVQAKDSLKEQLTRIEVRQVRDQEELRTLASRQKYTNSYLAHINRGPLTANFDFDPEQKWIGPPPGNLEPLWSSDRVYPVARDASLFLTLACIKFEPDCDPTVLPNGARRR